MPKKSAVTYPIEEIIKAARFVGDEGQPEYCNLELCARPAKSRSLCGAHYHYLQRYNVKRNPGKQEINLDDLTKILEAMKIPVGPHDIKVKDVKCHVAGCRGRKYEARGLCRLHYSRFANACRRGIIEDPMGKIAFISKDYNYVRKTNA